ncbi:MAG: hypothetical protein MJ229_04200 [bacterium]|nr:hypothetical protein [bacterium]
MIRICSLDFLNKDFFETDVKTADGKVLLAAGEKITPEVILELYFKEIYVDKPLEDVIVRPLAPKPQVQSVTDPSEQAIKAAIEALEQQEAAASQTPEPSQEQPVQKFEDTGVDDIVFDTKDLVSKEVEASTVDMQKTSETLSKEDIVKSEIADAVSHLQNAEKKEEEKIVFQNTAKQELPEPEPEQDKYGSIQPPEPEPEPELPKETDNLPFDEDFIGKLVAMTVEVGKLLNYAGGELEELKQAAYNCNLGVTKFTYGDLKTQDFENRKSAESFNLASQKGSISQNALNAIKLYPDRYNSAEFSLNKRIPYTHVLNIMCYYFRLKYCNFEQELILDKMLQAGGNKFNPFVLHKFVNVVKGVNG